MSSMRKENEQTNLAPLFSFYYITLGLWRSKLYFKLTTLLNSLWACAGPSPYQSLFWIFPGFCALILSDLFFPDFPRLDSSPLCCHFGSYCACVKILVHHLVSAAHALSKRTSPRAILVSTVHATQQRNFPYYFYPFPITSTNGSVVPWGDWKASSSCLLGC